MFLFYKDRSKIYTDPPLVIKINMKNMTALEFINLIRPIHDRTSCSDNDLQNGFFTRNGETWHGRCTRYMYLEIIMSPKNLIQMNVEDNLLNICWK
jgi:hypothetical protein